MEISQSDCEQALQEAVATLFDADPQIQAVGIARQNNGFGFKAVKNAAKILPMAATRVRRQPVPASIRNIPVRIESVTTDIEPHVHVSFPLDASLVPEQQLQRPLVCGLQIQNFDDDVRQHAAGQLDPAYIIIGTLGCFARLGDGSAAILSNNHVLAGENRGQIGNDRILQPGSLAFDSTQHVATLTNFVQLLPSPATARPATGTVIYNQVDAAVARIEQAVQFSQSYLPARQLAPPAGLAAPQYGDHVFKVGRTTGLTHGSITAVNTVVGPIPYAPGPCWFNQQFEIVGDAGTLFSDHGDSGSAIINAAGQVIGLLYAGNGTQTYACPIDAVLAALTCTLI